MVIGLSALINPDDTSAIDSTIQKHAIPRIRMILLSATDGTGEHIFWGGNLGDLAQTNSDAAEALVDAVIDEPSISFGIKRIAAAFAANWLLLSQVGIIESQQKIAYALEKQALADLDRLVKSPILKSSISSASTKLAASNVSASFYIANDLDPSTQSTITDANAEKTAKQYNGAQLPYPSADKAGQVKLWVNGSSITLDVNAGDTPAVVATKIKNKFDEAAAAITTTPNPFNANLAPDEIRLTTGYRYIPYTVPIEGLKPPATFTYDFDSAKLTILPHDYDFVMDTAVITIFFSHKDESGTEKPGIKGLLYGVSSNSLNLTFAGPHSIAANLKLGKSAAAVTSASSSASKILTSDLLFFTMDSTSIFTATSIDDTLVYNVNGVTDYTVKIPANSTAMDIVELLAQDMGKTGQTTALVAAIRPSTKFTVNGSPVTAPGIEPIAFGLGTSITKLVLTIKKVPAGVIFGVVPPTALTTANFDNRAKSVSVPVTLAKISGKLADLVNTVPTTVNNKTGGVYLSEYNTAQKPALQQILNMLKFNQDVPGPTNPFNIFPPGPF